MEKKNGIRTTLILKDVKTEVIKAEEARIEFEINFSNRRGMIEYMKLIKKMFEELK